MPLNADNFSNDVLWASLLIPFELEDADDDWAEIVEALQAKEWEFQGAA